MKTEIVPVRMNKEMLTLLDRHVKKLDVRGRSQLIREALDCLFTSDQPELRREMIEEFKMWRRSFWRVGGNLNQIARHMNSNHPLSTVQITDVIKELQNEFSELVKNMREIESGLDLQKGYK